MPQFKVGDVVVYTDDFPYRDMTKGKEYSVLGTVWDDAGDRNGNGIDILNDKGRRIYLLARRFTLKDKKKRYVKCIKTSKKNIYLQGMVYEIVHESDTRYTIVVDGRNRVCKKDNFIPWNEAPVAAPKEPIEQDNKLLVALDEKVKAKPAGLCHYALMEGGVERFQVGDICHARLRYGHDVRGDITDVALHLAQHYKDFPHKEEYKRYVDWIIQRSPWKSAFLPTSTEDALRIGVMLDVDKGINLLVSAAIMLRNGHEFSSQVSHFCDLVDVGFSENVAFITASLFSTRAYEAVENEYSEFSGNHHVFSDRIMVKDFKAFFNGGVMYAGEPFRKYKSYYRVFKLISGLEQEDYAHKEGCLRNYIFQTLDKKFIKSQKDNWGGGETQSFVIGANKLIPLAIAISKEIK